jgi:hypothetical protein
MSSSSSVLHTSPVSIQNKRTGFHNVFAAAAATEAPSCPSAAEVLGENQVLFSESQTALVGTLLQLSQDHLFKDWPPLGSDDDKKVSLLRTEFSHTLSAFFL